MRADVGYKLPLPAQQGCIARHIRKHGDFCGDKRECNSDYCRHHECSVRACHEPWGVLWPLAGNVGLCSKHHDHPTPEFASLVAASHEPPDDFDIPDWDDD